MSKNIFGIVVGTLLALTFTTNITSAQELATDGSRSVVNLNGQWQTIPLAEGFTFNYPPPAEGRKPVTVPDREPTSIPTVGGPYCPNINEYLNKERTDFKRKTGMAAWFMREFTLPAELPRNSRAILHFHGMAFKSETWFNDQKMGTWLFGQLPVEYDVTSLIKPGAANKIVVGLTEREALIDMKNKTFIVPSSGCMAGIWSFVELRFVPQVHVDDVFIKTSVKNKTIELETTLINQSSSPRTLTLGATITDQAQVPQTNIAPVSVTLAAGQKKVVTLKKDWIAPLLWTNFTPNLYFARVELLDGTNQVDARSDRFGFREFEIRGRDFYLNGKRTVLLRNSSLASLGTTKDALFPIMSTSINRPYNCYRLHLGFAPESEINMADECGMMIIPESSWHNALGAKFLLESRQVWLDNLATYTAGYIKLHRNHPSVIMWNLTNESIWGDTDDARMEIATKLVAAAKSVDSTRPLSGDGEVTWGNRLPTINIHYPEGELENAYSGKFSSSGLVYPNDFYWLNQDPTKINKSWRAKFKWDRPLIIGEYWCASGEPDGSSSFMGESAYDMKKWRMQDFSGRNSPPDSEYAIAGQRMTDAYRIMGVAAINPWFGDRPRVMPVVALRAIDFHPNFYGGTTGKRKIVIFNDSAYTIQHNSRYFYQLTINNVTVSGKITPFVMGPGEFKVIEIPVECPNVTKQTSAKLSIFMRWNGNELDTQQTQHDETIYIMPRENLADVDAAKIVLLDRTGDTAKTLQTIGLTLKPVTTLSAENLKNARTLIIGDKTDSTVYKNDIVAFAKQGGSVVILQQEKSTLLSPELPDIDEQHVSSRSWKRLYEHPILAGLDDTQLSYWQPENLVSFKTLRKPSIGTVRNILDCGGVYGMGWTPLAEVNIGAGTFVLSQMKLVESAAVEPAAARILAQSIRYAMNFKPEQPEPMRLLVSNNDALVTTLKTSSVVTTNGLAGQGPILLDASFNPTPEQLSQIKQHLSQGGKLWVHGFTSDNIAKIASLFPFDPKIEKFDPTMTMASRRSQDPLIGNLSSHDFCWARLDVGGNDFQTGGSPVAKLGTQVLHLPSVDAGTYLIEPALLVKVPVDKGVILFDTLAWENAIGTEADKVVRIVSSLAVNLGAKVQLVADTTTYTYHAADLSKVANMGYYDPTPNDGKGGWTDQGDNDMRFFLTNHTGKGGGVEGGMDVTSAEFPSSVTFNSRPFTLLDPKKTDNHAIISLRGEDHGSLLPDSAKGIVYNQKAGKLWFLHAAGWAPQQPLQEVARYVMHYQDGTQSVFPIHFGTQIDDWWSPAPRPNAKIAWSGRNLNHAPVCVYTTEWNNPHPEKIITTIDIIGNLSQTQIIVLSITGGVETQAASSMKLISQWNLAQLSNNQIKNVVTASGALQTDAKAPTLVQVDGEKRMRFRNGQHLIGDTRQSPGLLNGGPMRLDATLTVEEKSPGFCGGVFEAMLYGKKGFRLVVGSKINLTMEIFLDENPPKHLTSKTPLELGRMYDVSVEFDGKYAKMLLNGKLDSLIESPPPAAYAGPFQVGSASGKDYHFQGMIQQISFYSLN